MSEVNDNQCVNIIEAEKNVLDSVQTESKKEVENVLNVNGDASTSSIDPIQCQGNDELTLKIYEVVDNITPNVSESADKPIDVPESSDDLNSKTDLDVPVQQIKEIEVI